MRNSEKWVRGFLEGWCAGFLAASYLFTERPGYEALRDEMLKLKATLDG